MYLKQKIFYISIGAILLAIFQVGFHLPPRFASTGVVFASESRAGDKENVVAAIEQTWKDIALKNPDAVRRRHPDGSWFASSQGGLWSIRSNEASFRPAIDGPNTLDFKPRHINVTIVGEKQDVAYATYYLVGKILDADRKVIVKDYRTRASQVWVNLDGKWVVIGAHFSTLYGGSGVVVD